LTRNLIIRGFDDEIHSQLGELSRQKGISINSIVNDAVDKWLIKQKEIPRSHHLIIYDDDASIEQLLISTDKLAKEGEWFRCFIISCNFSFNDSLKKLEWFNSIFSSDKHLKKESMKYFIKVLQNILKISNDKQRYVVWTFL